MCDSNVNTISFHSFIVWFYVWAHNASVLVTVECAIELAGFGVALTCPTDDGEESDNDSESSSEHPKKTMKKAWHHHEVFNSGNLMSSSDSDAARDREVHGSQIDNNNDNTAEQDATSTIAASIFVVQGSANTSNHTANPGAIGRQVESVGNWGHPAGGTWVRNTALWIQ